MMPFLLILLPYTAAAISRDPTQPGNLPQPQLAVQSSDGIALNLTGIWISRTGKRASINGAMVSTGDKLADGSQIKLIKPSYVVLKQNGINKKLYLVPPLKELLK